MVPFSTKYDADCNKNNPGRCAHMYEDNRHHEDAEEPEAQQATSWFPTGATRKPPQLFGRKFQYQTEAENDPNVSKLEIPEWCEKSFIQFIHVLVARDKIERAVKAESQ